MLHRGRPEPGRDDPVRAHERDGGDAGRGQDVRLRPQGRGHPGVRAERLAGRRRGAQRAHAHGRAGRGEGPGGGLPDAKRRCRDGRRRAGGERRGGRRDVQGSARQGARRRDAQEVGRALADAQSEGSVKEA